MEEQNKNLKIQELESNQQFMSEKFEDLKKDMNKGFNRIEKKIKEQQEESEKKYAPKVEFKIVKAIVFSMVGLIALSFLGALIDNTMEDTSVKEVPKEVRLNK